MDREMMLEKDLWLREFIDQALKGMDEELKKDKEVPKKEAQKKETQNKEAA